MKKEKRKGSVIFKLLFFIVVLGIITGIIDYVRLNSNKLPLFAIKSYDSKKNKQTFRGIFYKAQRVVYASVNEDIVDSTDVSYIFLIFKLDINIPKEENNTNFTIITDEVINCNEKAKLYYSGQRNIYTYCLNSIKISKDNKGTELKDYIVNDKDIINKIVNNLYFSRTFYNQNIEMFEDISVYNFTNNGISLIKCKDDDASDIYIGPKNMTFQDDFCTEKEELVNNINTGV